MPSVHRKTQGFFGSILSQGWRRLLCPQDGARGGVPLPSPSTTTAGWGPASAGAGGPRCASSATRHWQNWFRFFPPPLFKGGSWAP